MHDCTGHRRKVRLLSQDDEGHARWLWRCAICRKEWESKEWSGGEPLWSERDPDATD